MNADAAQVALVAATALHAGFQLVVTFLVYPALTDVAEPEWQTAHERHSRRVAPVVVAVYGCLAVACLWVLLSGPTAATTLVAVSASAVAGGTTAAVAAPAHRRLGRGRDPRVLRRLVRADRFRLVAAVVALAAALRG